ncbi:MAG: lysophospholipid acyltransferase family protein [Gemmataceae bacterium]|nr:lysophospholipid acyltransferase family protein [Gemmataceae bacterium]
MARKRRRPAADLAVYLAVRLVVCVVQMLSVRVACRVAEFLARVVYRVDRRHRAVAADNLRHAFPELAADPARLDRLVRRTYRHFLLVAVEMMLAPRKVTAASWRRHANTYPAACLNGHLLRDRASLIVTGHFGNWELAGRLNGVFGYRTFAVARVLDNPHLERFVKRFRQGTGQTVIAKKDDFDRLTGVLGRHAKVATLADQDAGSRGVFVPFFGRPASTHKAVALMALEFDAVMLVIGAPRVAEPMYYAVECEDVIDPREYRDRGDAVKAITQRYHDALARMIRRHPEQYFWLHRRWKSQPAARKAKPTLGERPAA